MGRCRYPLDEGYGLAKAQGTASTPLGGIIRHPRSENPDHPNLVAGMEMGRWGRGVVLIDTLSETAVWLRDDGE